jgi:uncharacterized protein YdhG (YjbR/CyaY superfamily)
MPGPFATVDEYIDGLPEDVQPVMEGIRRSIRRVVPDVGEKISYQMPTFTLDGAPLVHVAAWKKHIGLYPLPQMDGALAQDVAPYRGTKDTMRLPLGPAIPYELLERVLAVILQQRLDGAS